MANVALKGGLVTTKEFPLQLRKDLDKMFKTTLIESKSEFDKIFKVVSAPKTGNYQSSAEIAGLGLPYRIGEGESVPFDQPAEGFEKNRTWDEYGMGYTVTQRMLDDERYGMIKKMPPALAKSMKVFTDQSAFKVFNEGNAAGEDHTLAKDGLAVFGTHYLLDDRIGDYSAGISNLGTPGALSETTLQAAFEYYDNLVDENGYPVEMDLNMLVVNTGDRYIASKLKTQMYGSVYDLARTNTAGAGNPGTANLNQANPENGFVDPWNILVSRYLEDDRWALTAKQPDNGLTLSWKYQPTQDTYKDFDTRNHIYRGLMRFGYWCDEWRGVYLTLDS